MTSFGRGRITGPQVENLEYVPSFTNTCEYHQCHPRHIHIAICHIATMAPGTPRAQLMIAALSPPDNPPPFDDVLKSVVVGATTFNEP